MEERGEESSLAVDEPCPSRPPGDEKTPQEAVARGLLQCDPAERNGEIGCSPAPQDLSALCPGGCDVGARGVAALEHVADDVSAASGNAGDADDSLNPQFEQAAESGEAEALIPQGSGAASASCVDGGDTKIIAFEADAGNTAAGDADLLKEEAHWVSMEETENTIIPKSQQGKNGGQEEVLMPRESAALSHSGSDGGIQELTALKSDSSAAITGDSAASAAEEEISKMDVDGTPISKGQEGKDSKQEEASMPPSSSAVSPSGSDDVLLKIETVENVSTAIAMVDNDAVEVAVSNMDVDTVPIKQVICAEVDVSVSKSSTSSPSSFVGIEKVAAFEHDAVATSCDDDDDALKEEVVFADVDNLDSLPLSLSEQMEDVKDPEILVSKGSLSELPSDSDRGLHNTSAIETDTAAINHESADAIDDEPTQMDVEVDETRAAMRRGGGRRKRGRPAKSQVARTTSRRKEEEEVCFICFDGGDLVVCDRRGCPKAYHPSCVNRDEAFFRAKGKWSCGWHICSSCERSARYMCFICTHSLCKGCFKKSGFICVRGNKGFCETCMSTVMLIETNEHRNETTIGVDFDDRTSFEYLFKDYWFSLKAKLLLTLEELTSAKNSVKKPDAAIGNESSDDLHTAKEEQVASSDSSSENKEERIASRRNLRKRSKNSVKEEGSVKDVENAGTSISRDIDWASEELLEFVVHMKNGDRSALSQFDVQGLLLEYIKKKNLRDPRRKSQIICDARLQNLFGKERVGHFEMLKLLESHFFTKEVSTLDTEDKQGGVVDPDPDPTDVKGNGDSSIKITLDKKRKARKKAEKEALTNADDYAAIDVHNISLMYLRRNLMEELIDDLSSLDDTIIRSFVRIRISGVGQRQDMYRLVQVVGTCKATDKYKSGKKTTDVTLEILNLSKKEIITVDIISNQDFTEEECKRLRQSIKCGLIGRLTVGDVQEKARSLQAVRINDWLESEKLRLGHLRDRASEKGHRKELRECVEKLQLLNTPEERQRRLHELPEIHADPHMNPEYESAEEEEESDLRKKDYYRSRGSSFLRNGREVKSPGKGGSALSDSWISLRKNPNSWESNRSALIEGASVADTSTGRGVDTNEFSLNQANDASLDNEKQHAVRLEQSSDGPQGIQMTSLPGGPEIVTNINQSDKIWHYKDPSGKIQGSFSMTQLRKWSTTGYFPPNLKIWKTSENQEDSILLTDALVGKFEKDLPRWVPPSKTTPQPMVVSPTGLSAGKNSDAWRGSNEFTSSDSKQNAQKWNIRQNEKWANPGERISPEEVDTKFAQEQRTSTPLASQPSVQYHENLSPNSISHRVSSSILKVPPANDSSYQWRNDSSTMPTPTQPISKGWLSEEGSSDKSMPCSAPVQDMRSGWNNMRGKEEPGSSFHVDEPSRTTSNSFRELGSGSARYVLDQTVMSDCVRSLPVASHSAADSVCLGQSMTSTHHPNETDAMNNFKIRNYELNLSANVENQRSLILPLKDEINKQSNWSLETKMMLTQEQAASCRLEDNQNDPYLSRDQHNNGKELLRTHDEFSNGNVSAHEGISVPSASFHSERPAYQLDSKVLSENPREKINVSGMENFIAAVSSKFVQADSERNPTGLACSLDKNIYQTSAVAYPGYNLIPEKVTSEAPNLGIRSSDVATNLIFQPDVPEKESSSAHRSQTPAAPNPGPYLASSESMHSANLKVTMHMKSKNNPNQSARQMTPYGWNSVPGSTSVNKKNVQLLSSADSNPPFPSQFGGNAATVPVQQTQPGFGSVPNVQNTSFSMAPQNPSPNSAPVQGTGNMSWIPAPQGNMNAGWGVVSQGNMSMSWGQPAQTRGNMNVGMAAPNQVNMMNPGWVAPPQGNANMNVGWVTPVMANANQTPGWGGQLQGNFPENAAWAMLVQGQTNPGPGPGPSPSPGWVAPVPPNAPQNWGTPNQGTMNMNTTWGPGQGTVNPPMNPSVGNPQSLNSQPPPSGDRHSSQSEYARVNDSVQSNRRPSWNRVQPGGGSSAPPRGQTGICWFHETGHCKKGASCNYFHP